ncbi:serine/threonine protein kinase [Tolypothrix sp. PCC 7910]|uniref:serine/threonine-protein kinase n=1 Tax=Tolypothrix sp. PCC 7910 TaxID=2099387 RepID=UPI0014278D9A|nr:serine/threonine-protein kinase [Tolypothrix sp. PCC 7910]QIR41059.1 serine/threonine protein kinase [Tolypothrix sp. PCC 7910]
MLGNLLDGRYQVLQVLGGGGFGQTYIAQDTHRPGSPRCVVKHLKPFTQNPEFLTTARRLFTSEAETLEKLGYHDQIPRLLAYFEENHEFFLVQEFIVGYSLKAELLPGRRWTEEQVVQLLQQILGVLDFVHGHQVIHRDIKPDNIIRRQTDSKLVLIDFGAVKQIQTQLRTAITGHVETTIAIGTPGYMSTEQGQGKPRPNSDIYSLGIIAIQALTGLHPRQLQEDPNTGEILWENQANVSPGLAAVLSKMVLYHFKERYQSAAEVLEALRNLEINSDTEIENQFTQPPLSAIQLPQILSSQQNTFGQPTASVLSPEQHKHLEDMLLELVGPLAPTLLRKIAASANSYQEVIENLTQHLAGQQKTEFEEKSRLILRETTNQSQSQPKNTPQTSTPTISDSFVRKCEQELVNLIGPMGSFLVQKAIKASPNITPLELVNILSSQIPDRQKSLEFQQRLFC